MKRFWDRVKKGPGCWDWMLKYKNRPVIGYGTFDGIAAHRFSYALANGPIPNGCMVLHKCNNPACVRPSHLYAGTNSDNMKDRASSGWFKKGEPSWRRGIPCATYGGAKQLMQNAARRCHGSVTTKYFCEATGLKITTVSKLLARGCGMKRISRGVWARKK